MKRILRIGMDVHSTNYTLCAIEPRFDGDDIIYANIKVTPDPDNIVQFIENTPTSIRKWKKRSLSGWSCRTAGSCIPDRSRCCHEPEETGGVEVESRLPRFFITISVSVLKRTPAALLHNRGSLTVWGYTDFCITCQMCNPVERNAHADCSIHGLDSSWCITHHPFCCIEDYGFNDVLCSH